MAKESPLGLQETKGSFQLRGKITGTEKDNFYKEMTTKTNKAMRMVSFGAEINEKKTVYLRLNGMEQENVFFSKSEKSKDGKTKTEVKKIPWSERFKFHEDGYRMIGVNLGIKKTYDPKGNEVNDKKTMTPYDACKYIGEEIEDGSSVFVRGNIEFSTYNDSHRTNFVPNQISLCKPIDYTDENFEQMADFEQTIVFMSIAKREHDFLLSAKIITYNTIEDAEFVISDAALAKNFKSLKPYTAIKVYGNIIIENDTEQAEETTKSYWGKANPMEKVNTPTVWKLEITGADPETIDTELYTEKAMDAAIEKINSEKTAKSDYGKTESDNDGWGTPKKKTETEETDEDEDDIPW